MYFMYIYTHLLLYTHILRWMTNEIGQLMKENRNPGWHKHIEC